MSQHRTHRSQDSHTGSLIPSLTGLLIGAILIALGFVMLGGSARAATPVTQVVNGGTGSTTLTGILKGNLKNSILSAIGDVDFQKPISLTTTGSSGVSTFTGDILNIPNYVTPPGGLNLQVQYNNGGVFGGISGAVTNGTILNLTNPLLGGATLTTSSVNGVTLTTGGATTNFLNANGAYSVPVGTTYTASYPITLMGTVFSTAFSTTTANIFSALNTFNGGLTIGTLTGTLNANNGITYATATSTPTVTAPITYSGTLGSFIGGISGALACTNASSGVTGCLTGTDWNTFNGKQAAGNYITALTGDGTASGPGSSALTLATVNSNVGTFTYPSVTVNGKGLITAISNGTAPTTYTGTYPIQVTGSVISTAFGTTTSNTWGGTQTFTNAPDFASISNGTLNISNTIVYSTATSTISLGTGIGYSGTMGSEIGGISGTLTNTGVTSIVAGTGISISGATGAVTITATGGGGSGVGTVSTSTLEVSGNVPVWSSTSGYPATLTNFTGFTFTGASGQLGIPTNGWLTTGGNLFAYASSTNSATIFGLNAGGQNATTSATEGDTVAIGNLDLSGLTTGTEDTAVGTQAGQDLTIGSNDAFFGVASALSGTTETNDTYLGFEAGALGTSSSENVGIGNLSLFDRVNNTSGTTVGSGTGGGNTAIGYQALAGTGAGDENTAVGYEALSADTSGRQNVAFGSIALAGNTIGIDNLAIGSQSLNANTSGGFNISIGNNGLINETTGYTNLAIGYGVLASTTSGYGNILIGNNDSKINTIVQASGNTITTGFNNIGIGNDINFPLATGNGQLNIDNLIFGSNAPATSTNNLMPALTGYLGIGTTTPHSLLELATSTGPQLTLYDGSANSPWNFIERNGSLWFATSSLTTFATSTNSIFSIIPSATANATTTFSLTDWVLKQTSQTAFNILDGFGTHVVGVNTASTTGNVLQVNATTTPDSAFWGSCGSPSSTNPACLFAIDSYGHMLASTTGATPTVSCAPSGGTLSANSNDVTGVITGGTLSTSCTLTFAHPYGTTPNVQSTGSNIFTGVTAQSTTAFTVSMVGTTGDVIQYLVTQP